VKINFANYSPAILPEHRGNPLLEALEPKVRDEVLVQRLSHYPPFSPEEKKLEAFERVEYLTRLKDLRQPLPLYLRCFRAIETAMKEGYSSRNPLSPTTQNYLHYTDANRPQIEPESGFFNPKGSGITLIGESGVGKTCMLEQILSYFPDAIEHTEYHGIPLNLRQVIWLKVDCPNDSSVKALCLKILAELDKKLSLPKTKPEATIPALLEQIDSRIRSSFLGILVIDEMQNLNLAKAGGAERLIGFLHNVVNSLGIPILFCANPPFNKLLAETLKTGRRAENSGYFDVELMENNEIWELFIDSLWELQWTDTETKLTRELSDSLYDLSVGNMDLAVRIFREAQRCVIGTGDERISVKVLEYAASNTVKASAEIVNQIRIQKKEYDALTKAKGSISKLNETQCEDDAQKLNEPIATQKDIHTVPSDLTRPHHPEFANKLRLLQQSLSLDELLKDPDCIQRSAEGEDPEIALKSKGLLYINPLHEIS
tara:strand:- start:3744 stop:5201 length:1458 start_codon:yes stop_codon:yes gene_type:complete